MIKSENIIKGSNPIHAFLRLYFTSDPLRLSQFPIFIIDIFRKMDDHVMTLSWWRTDDSFLILDLFIRVHPSGVWFLQNSFFAKYNVWELSQATEMKNDTSLSFDPTISVVNMITSMSAPFSDLIWIFLRFHLISIFYYKNLKKNCRDHVSKFWRRFDSIHTFVRNSSASHVWSL